MHIEVKNLTKRMEHTLVLDRINLEIHEREFLGLLGPSGSGKTTLLRILAGLDVADSGTVQIDGRNAMSMSVEERRIGFVFQHYALFNHMTVFENVAFGLRVKKRRERPNADKIIQRVLELLDLVRLKKFSTRFPQELSGGQRQRVALARTLAIDPQVLLLDEPFGALDAKVRLELRRSLRDIHDVTGLTTVFVTHDREEALDLADRVAIINRGRIEQIGSPSEVYDSPETPFVFDFLDRTNSFDCVIADGKARLGGKLIAAGREVPDGPGVVFVRPHDILLAPPRNAARGEAVQLPGKASIRFISTLGQRATVELQYEDRLVEAEIDRDRLRELELAIGNGCVLYLRQPRIYSKRDAETQTGIAKRAPARVKLREQLRKRLTRAE
jgi:sulfate transport system ATP-binding protein